MPGAGIVGKRYRKPNGASSLPPQARNMSRLLGLAPDQANEVFQRATEGLPFKIEISSNDNTEITQAFESAMDRYYEQKSEKKYDAGYYHFLSETSGKDIVDMSREETRKISLQWDLLDYNEQQKYSEKAKRSQTIIPKQTSAVAATVSDHEGESSHEKLPRDEIWTRVLEKLHLEVAAVTTRNWGRKKMYEVYQMAGPAMPVTEDVCEKIVQEFTKVSLGMSNNLESKVLLKYSDCRAYMTCRGKEVWIQINIGKPFDYTDLSTRNKIGEKKKKAPTEYIALVTPESSLIALTASRAASTARFTPVVFAALENSLTCTISTRFNEEDLTLHRIGNLSGHDPAELLEAAQTIQFGKATGRFAQYASAGKAFDPIAELHNAATESLLSRTEEDNRLKISEREGFRLSRRVASWFQHDEEVVAANNQGEWVTHARKRTSSEAFGGDCPKQTSLRWKWKGSFDECDDFQCKVSLKGSDVFAGLEAMAKAGLIAEELPPYVKDAPSLGTLITVDADTIVTETKYD